ncbi:MAG: helix-turn-helix domain-containing protein, partial [Planctomycetales bacterium]
MAKLRKEHIVTLQVLHEQGESNRKIAKRLKVTEGTIRYHVRRQTENAQDGRKKLCLIEKEGLQEVVRQWWDDQMEALPAGRSPNVQELWDHLVEDHKYDGSVKSVRKYVWTRFPKPKLRPFRRIETPPGAQTQSDWCEVNVDLGGEDGHEKLYGFVMVLSHSRKEAVVWSRSMKQLAWHRVHNEAFQRLGGVAAVNRIDNLKTGVAKGAGPWGVIN